jgi:hypothetical protein
MTMAKRVLAELRRLRKGRGVEAAKLNPATAPHLCELAGDSGGVPDRQALIREIRLHAENLRRDLKTALLAGLGLLPETRAMTTLTSRVEWLASQTHYQNRTMLRRIESAEKLVAEEIVRELLRRRGRGPVAVNDWYVEELNTVLRLDTERPEARERRRIVALKEGLTEVMAWMDIPGTPDKPQPLIDAEVVYGGKLVRTVGPQQNQFRVMVALPVPLAAGRGAAASPRNAPRLRTPKPQAARRRAARRGRAALPSARRSSRPCAAGPRIPGHRSLLSSLDTPS